MWHYLIKYEKVSTGSLKYEYILSYGQRKNPHINMVWIFYIFALDLKIWT